MPAGIYNHKSCSETTRQKISDGLKNRIFSEEHKRKISEALKGKKASQEIKDKMSKSHIGLNTWMKGKKLSTTIRDKISRANKGKKLLDRTKQKLSEQKRGEKNPQWRGGKSFEPYSVDWTKTLKKSIRERDKYTCQICGKEPSVYVHHIDYNKKNCNPNNLIILCQKCHPKTNGNRDYWTNLFFLKKKWN